MKARDVAVPIVFPNYLIAVATPRFSLSVPGTSRTLTIPSTKQRLPHLGHAGILFIQGTTGTTKYFEYGRYDPAARGLVEKRTVPDATMGRGGRPTAVSLRTVLSKISSLAGQGGIIEGAYIELPAGAFDRMLSYAAGRKSENANPNRREYSLLDNSCIHFAKETAEAGGADMPSVIDPRPSGYIDRVRSSFPALDFTPPTELVIQGITLP